MAQINLTRQGENFQKKMVCVASADLRVGVDGFLPGSNQYKLFNLPEMSQIINARISVLTASNAGTSAVATIGTTATGGTNDNILASANLATVGEQGTAQDYLDTGTGSEVWLNVVAAGTAATAGRFLVLIEYIEYDKNTGEYTVFD